MTDKKNISNIVKSIEGWAITKLEDISTIILGQSPSSTSYNFDGKGLPFFQGKKEFGAFYPKIAKWCTEPKKIALKNDVLISVRAPVGPTNLSPTECCIGRGLAAIRPNAEISYKYLLYYLRSIESNIESLGTGTTFKAISGSILKALLVPLAPSDEQKRIVAEIEKQFSRLDEAVANLKRIKANLKRYKASILKAAVEGKLTEDWRKANPDVEPADKLLERILVERRRKWEETELAKMKAKGKVPKDDKWKKKYKKPGKPDIDALQSLPDGWIWVNIDQIMVILTDYHANGSYKILKKHVTILDEDGYAIYVRSKNLNKNIFDSDLKFVNKKAYDFLAKSKIFGNEIIIGKIGNAGKIYYMPKLDQPCTLGMNLFMLRFNQFLFDKYIYYHLVSFFSEREIKSKVKGVGNPSIDKNAIRSLRIALPPIKEQDQIIKVVDERMSLIIHFELELERYLFRTNRLHQSILKKAFSGKLVPQDPNDESASILIEKIKQKIFIKDTSKMKTKKRRTKKRGRKLKSSKIKRKLLDVLSEHPDGIRPELLLVEANYSIDEIDGFYAQLGKISNQIDQTKPTGKQALKWPFEAEVTLRLRSK